MSEHIVILGAGISGLTIGWYLKQVLGSRIQITILEKEDRVGGWIQTIQQEGFLWEQGPHACRPGNETLALIQSLGLQDQVIIPHPTAKNRYIYEKNRLCQVPTHLWEIPFNSLTKGWIRALWSDLRGPKRQGDDESIYAFFSRRVGQEWTEMLIDPLVSGIYAGDCKRLSVKSCFPLCDQWEKEKGSLICGAWNYQPKSFLHTPLAQLTSRYPLFTFQEGMETLPKTLSLHLKENIKLNQKIKKLHLFPQQIEIQLENGHFLQADYLISTVPSYELAPLLIEFPEFIHLEKMNYASVAVIHMGYQSIPLSLKGYGYLVPSKLRSMILGCIWSSSVFPQHNQWTSLTMMLGGVHHPECENLNEDELMKYAISGVHEHLKIHKNPTYIKVKIAKKAIPQFEVGDTLWKKRLKESVERYTSRMILGGSYWSGVSINDCIGYGQQLANQVAAFIKCSSSNI